MLEEDELYKQKYLKYKAKYLELKRYEQEGGVFDTGFAIVFTSNDNATKLKTAMAEGKIGGRGDIANLLDRKGYIIFDGKKPAELLESNTRLMKEKLNAAAAATASAATSAYNVSASVASKVATVTTDAAVSVKNSAVNQYNKYQEQKQKSANDKVANTSATDKVANTSANNKADLIQPKTQETNVQDKEKADEMEGGADLPLPLPLTIATLDNKTFDRANDSHKKHIANAVAEAFGVSVSDISMVTIKFKMFGRPELRE